VLWLNLTTHVAALTGGAAVGCWTLRRRSDALLRLVAGLVAILGRDQRSRAERALDVLQATQRSEKSFSVTTPGPSKLGRARGVPDRTVIGGESRSLTGTTHQP
jgi:hypothetical protein